jgi:DNA-binding NarL/FixJ family response regulator
MYQAIIIDRWHLTTAGITGLLEHLSLFRTIQTVSDVASILATVNVLKPDICIINLSSFPIHFQEIIRTTRDYSPKTKIVIFSTRSEHPFYTQSLRAGAHCCISLETDQRDMHRAIRYALRNERFICPTVMRHLSDTLGQDSSLVHLRFSVKELQVFLLLGQGKSTHEIALELHISDQTVSTYKNRIFRKSNFKTNTSILKYIEKHGLAI